MQSPKADRHQAMTQIHSLFFGLSAYQDTLYVTISCMLSRHHMSFHKQRPFSSQRNPLGAGIPRLSG